MPWVGPVRSARVGQMKSEVRVRRQEEGSARGCWLCRRRERAAGQGTQPPPGAIMGEEPDLLQEPPRRVQLPTAQL